VEKEGQIAQMLEAQQSELQETKSANQKLGGELNVAQSAIEQLNHENARLKTQHTQELEARAREFDKYVQDLSCQCELQKQELAKAAADLAQEVAALKSELEKANNEKSRWRRSMKFLKAAQEAKERQLQELEQKCANREKEELAKFGEEKQTMRDKYEKVLEQLKSKNQSLRQLVAKARSTLSECEIQVRELSQANSALTIERNELRLKSESSREEIRREKQLLETKLKASELAMKMQSQAEIEEQRERIEREKREVLAMIANQFKQYYDPRNELDAHTVQQIVEKASGDLNRFVRQDTSLRKIVGIGSSDSLEEAMTTIVLAAYHP
jgi:chromosome segregation ATPase